MKTLHYSIIVILSLAILIPLSTVFGQNVTVSNNLSDGNVFHLVAKDTALPGDMMEINGSLVTKDPIKITLSNPNGTIQVSITTFADRDGYFTAQLKMPKDAIGGTWKIIGKSGNYQRELDVDVPIPDVTRTTYCCLISNYTGHVVILSPLKQFKSGIKADDIKCNNGLSLVIKAEDDSPACITPQTAQKLVERGWGWAMQTMDSIKPLLPNRIMSLENDAGVITLRNQTYYFETPNYTDTAFSNPVQISFHDVIFTLFPSGFKGGLPTDFGGVATNGCGGSYFWTDTKFPDGIHELLHIFAITTMSQHCQVLPAPTDFSNHTNPQAGLTFYDGKMKLLTSVDNQVSQKENTTLPASFEPCDTPYPQSNTGVAVLYMPANSIGKICIRYSNLNDTPEQIFGIRIFDPNNSYQNVTSIITWNDLGNNYTIPKEDSFTGVYWIKTGNQTGFFGLDLFCGGTPFAVGYDNNSKIVSSDFPFIGRTYSCPAMSYEYHIDSLTGIGVKYIPYP